MQKTGIQQNNFRYAKKEEEIWFNVVCASLVISDNYYKLKTHCYSNQKNSNDAIKNHNYITI